MQSLRPTDEETQWWLRLQQGDSEALAFFYERYADWLLQYGLSIIFNREAVRDGVQELFIHIWNRRQNLSLPDSAKYYLMSSLRRILLKEITRERLSTDDFPEESISLKEHDALSDDEIERQMHKKLMKAVRQLPARQQEIVFLRFFEKLSYEQISDVTGLDYQVLRNTIYRSVKTLKKQLSHGVDWLLPLVFLLNI
jgi:RNA polymerase sigma factor (sigma-70 family)